MYCTATVNVECVTCSSRLPCEKATDNYNILVTAPFKLESRCQFKYRNVEEEEKKKTNFLLCNPTSWNN